ncbi:MAG: D-glycero-D-manno-heptose 1,7-bisphosphate phosphatase [Pseudomonadota bacterium]|nr:D-glycero-D-manno-heptose 1,7-bisphosphate phosphatase [Pseudomonadota bacterium]
MSSNYRPESGARLVVLDRDGVINRESAEFIKSADEWLPLPGSLEAIAALSRAGFAVVVATNQSGVGRGLISSLALEEIHSRMVQGVEQAGGKLAGIFYCPHRPEDDCSCRKPRPGLLQQIEARFGCSLKGQPVIGDSARDLQAAVAVSARAILVRTGNGLATERKLDSGSKVEVFDDLAAAANSLIRNRV